MVAWGGSGTEPLHPAEKGVCVCGGGPDGEKTVVTCGGASRRDLARRTRRRRPPLQGRGGWHSWALLFGWSVFVLAFSSLFSFSSFFFYFFFPFALPRPAFRGPTAGVPASSALSILLSAVGLGATC